jgi:(1->4)-alpha-D-glucan 1-alpha-D-glucosylmutase
MTRRTVVSTYRLQLHSEFRFPDAAAVVDYLDDLRVTHLYVSPVVASVAGSRHGYDVIDPTRVDPELGGREGLEALAAAAHERGLGLVLDIVPNHLAASPDNPWWWEMLRDGPGAEHAPGFDVDWSGGRIILPVLDRPVDEAIAAGTVTAHDGVVHVGDLRLAARDDDTSGDVREVLDRQFYELADWQEPRRNYRRFFDVDSLVGVRVEDPAVFEDRHALLLDLVHRGIADGLRVDHIDGLRDPRAYLERLRARTGPDVFIAVEKILTGDERLRAGWPVDGTTGYEVMTDLDDLLVDPHGWDTLAAANRAEGIPPFGEIEAEAKRFVLGELFTPELRRIVRDHPDLAEAVAALTIALPVYRTYIDDHGAAEADREVLRAGVQRASGDVSKVVDLLEAGDDVDFAMRWQQLTSPVMAKGHEDTALYRDVVLVSRNDVGGDPGRRPDDALDRFHRRTGDRARDWPRTMAATSTHDTKRSEDVRARISVLSELPGEFEAGLARLRGDESMRALSPVEQRLVAQTLLGVVPTTDTADKELPDRVHAYFEKALRESKQWSSWIHPDTEHEAAVHEAVDRLLAGDAARLRDAFGDLVERVAHHGLLNSLVLTVLRVAGPGVADTYQGTELIDLSLVDPDNRRPVDYATRREALASLDHARIEELCSEWSDGRLKLLVLTRALGARRAHPDLFVGGEYLPLRSEDDRLVAFARRRDDDWGIALASRFTTRGLARGTVALPPGAPTQWRDALTGATVVAKDGELPLDEAFAQLPVALLLPSSEGQLGRSPSA